MSLNKCGDVLAPREVCCELCNPLYEVCCSPRDILGQHSPGAAAARRPSSPAPLIGGQRGGEQALSRGGNKPEGWGTPLCPQTQHGGCGVSCPRPPAWRSEQPRARAALAEGLQGHTAPEKSGCSTTEGKGQPAPESWHRHPGCRQRPLANAFHAAGLGRSGGAALESPPAPAGKAAALPAAGSFLLISCSLPVCQRRHPAPAAAANPLLPSPASAATEPRAEDGNRPWGTPAPAPPSEAQRGRGPTAVALCPFSWGWLHGKEEQDQALGPTRQMWF